MQAAITSRTSLESDLRLSIERQELRLYYQPVVDAHGGTLGAEALVRWLHPVRGLVSPATFIPLAEQTGLILPIGQWVLETACAQLQQWARIPYKAARTIAVNISAKQFQHPNFVNSILALIETTGINPRRLKLELTESLLVQEVEEAITRMELLRARGLKFSLDDFGTGYSSLSYLKRLPLDQLKIDQSFVRDLLTDPNDVAIVRTILALANSLGLSVVAEGVETVEQEDILIANGCRQFQGYLYSRPVPIEQWQ
jgi:EAL domain-containing protein (putative c-di-GMP-specific phosphodiesterase class I)